MASRTRVLVRLAVTAFTIALLTATWATTALPTRASGQTATVVVVGSVVIGGPDDTISASGYAGHVGTSWRRGTGGSWQSLSIDGPQATGLAVGSWDVAWTPDTTHGSLAITGTTCLGGHVTILEAPVLDAGGDVLSFAAEWSGCTSGSGAVRIGSAVPLAAVRDSGAAFGAQDSGTTEQGTVTFHNAGNVALAVNAVTLSADPSNAGLEDFSMPGTTCVGTLDPGMTCSVDVAFRPTAKGLRSARVTLDTVPAAAGAVATVTGTGTFALASNDSIGNAAEVGSLPYEYYGDVQAATTDRLDPVCDGGFRRTVWFHYHATTSGPVAIETSESVNQDTVIGVYSGSAPDDLALVVCHDNMSASDLTSLARFPAAQGTDYWIVVAEGQQGRVWELTLTAVVGAPDTTVDVSGWAVSPTTFYPYPDGFRDTTRTTAVPGEPVDVSIEVVSVASPAVVLRRSTVGRREAAYGWTWDGKNDAGTRVLGGSYLVRHRYVDVFGNTSSHDVPVTVSSKRLYFTTTSKTLYGYKTYDRGAWGSKASTRVSGTSLILKSGSGHANAMYRFSLVTATVYKSVRFEVLGKSANGRKVDMWTWNAANGDWDAFRRIGPGYAWWKAPTADGWAHVVGGKAYGQVEAFNTAGSSTWIIYKVRLTYTYGVLK